MHLEEGLCDAWAWWRPPRQCRRMPGKLISNQTKELKGRRARTETKESEWETAGLAMRVGRKEGKEKYTEKNVALTSTHRHCCVAAGSPGTAAVEEDR